MAGSGSRVRVRVRVRVGVRVRVRVRVRAMVGVSIVVGGRESVVRDDSVVRNSSIDTLLLLPDTAAIGCKLAPG